MKGHATLMSRASDEWSTPDDLFQSLHALYRFEVDAAATAQNKKCDYYLGPDSPIPDALAIRWAMAGQRLFCNPPYSKLYAFLARAHEAMRDGCLVVMLMPARTDTKSWHQYIYDLGKGDWRPGVSCLFLKGRLKFGGAKSGAPFPSAIVTFDGRERKDSSAHG